MDTTPTEDELRAFVTKALSELDTVLREPEVVEESIRENREMWLLLYRASHGADLPGS